ncbi:unnamed protein product [Calypogeia fissa]
MHRVYGCVCSSLPSKGRTAAVGAQQGPFSVKASAASASVFSTTSTSEGFAASKFRAEERITMPYGRSESLGLQAMRMSPGEQRGGAMVRQQGAGRRPVLLMDVMDTIVRDPFHVDMPAFFGLTFKELLACKHPTAWIEFEKGLLTEEEFAVKMFNDKRGYDYEGLKQCMANGYEYVEGMESLLQRLKATGIDMHIFSNYPTWYTMIEDKLNLSQYLPWTFVSCHTGLRKPSQEAFLDAAEWLGVHPSDCVFIDDQPRNTEAASNVGMAGIRFQSSQGLEKELALYGISLEPLTRSQKTL